MHYVCVFEGVIVCFLAYLSHSGNLSSCKGRTLYWLFETFLLFAAGAFSPSSFFFEFFCFFFFFDRMLVSVDALGHLLAAQTRTEKDSCGD